MTGAVPTAAVIGGGPAGLMAAEGLAQAGVAVTVYDLHRSVGRKFLLAGRSGLNLTHSEPFERLLARYEPMAPQLEAALRAFGPEWLQAWAADLGESTFVGSSGRIFPESFRAAPLLRAWLRRLVGLGVEFQPGHRWSGWTAEGSLRFDTDDRQLIVEAGTTVLALGGASWPRVSSDGSWSELLRARGVAVAPLRAANCGVEVSWSDVFIDRFEGEPVKNVVVSAADATHRGEMVITRNGLEGGPVYAASGAVRQEFDRVGSCAIRLDLAPDLSIDRLVTRLAARRPKETQSSWLRRAGLAPVAVGLLRESTKNQLPNDALALASLVKAMPLTIAALMPIDRAISSAGGVSFAAVDDHLMLHDVAGCFVVGEMLDWDAPTGGYLLQACFATGAAGAAGAGEWLNRRR